MSDLSNLYREPDNPSVPEKLTIHYGDNEPSPKNTLTEPMLLYLYQASPWLRFVGILCYIVCGFLIIGGIIAAIVMFAISDFTYVFDGLVMGLVWLLYVPMGILYFFPARFIYNFGAKIRNYRFTKSGGDLEQALKYNKSFWKFVGILSIIFIATIPLSIFLAIIGGVVAAVGGRIF